MRPINYAKLRTVALQQSRLIWGCRSYGSPPDVVVDMVEDTALEVVMTHECAEDCKYVTNAARWKALRLARQEWTIRKAMKALETQAAEREAAQTPLDELADMRMRIAGVVVKARTLPPPDKDVLARLIYDETTCADTNAVRRLRRRLEG